MIVFFKQKTAYEMRISDWSSDVCSSDLLDLGARPLAEQDLVAGLDVERRHLAVLGLGASPGGDDFAFLRLFLGGIGNDNAAGRLFLSLDAANQHTIVQRTKFHASSFPWVSSDECFGTPRRRVPAARHMRKSTRLNSSH